jgi:hypothetical protein
MAGRAEEIFFLKRNLLNHLVNFDETFTGMVLG